MLSKYQRISQDLIDKIDKQEIKVHSYLPSENELMKLYNASRDTIRKALDILLKNGYHVYFANIQHVNLLEILVVTSKCTIMLKVVDWQNQNGFVVIVIAWFTKIIGLKINDH